MYTSSIKNWAEEDRPREKLLLKGKETLSDAELLAIIIGSGSKDESAVDLSRRIMTSCEDLNEMGRKSLEYFMEFKGVGQAKAITIAAALELGRRRQLTAVQERPTIHSSQDAYNVIGPILADLPHEEFWIACLNRKNVVLSKHQIGSGGVHGVYVDAKIIFTAAIRQGAAGIILYHNHPSGQPKPSPEDKHLTSKVISAGNVLDIRVLDHIIVGNGSFYSFLDEGELA